MADEALVSGLVPDGRRLIDKLAGWQVELTAAFWAMLGEDDRYYLYLAMPLVQTIGPRVLSAQVRRAIAELRGEAEPLSLLHEGLVRIVPPTHPVVRDLVEWTASSSIHGDSRYSSTQFGGVWVADMYVYALPAPTPAAT